MIWEVTRWRGDGPSVLTLRLSAIEIDVHRHIHEPDDMWLMSARGAVTLSRSPLDSKELGSAKTEALLKLLALIDLIRQELRDVLEQQRARKLK